MRLAFLFSKSNRFWIQRRLFHSEITKLISAAGSKSYWTSNSRKSLKFLKTIIKRYSLLEFEQVMVFLHGFDIFDSLNEEQATV